MSDQRDPIAEHLTNWRDTYVGRRTVPWQMLDEAERIVRAAAAYHELRADAEIARSESAHEQELERLQDQLDRARKSRDEWHEHYDRVQRALDAKYRTAEERRRNHDDPDQADVVVTTGGGKWTVATLEELAYRIRAGGGDDATIVAMSDMSARAVVPVPNLVPLQRLDDTRAVRMAEERPPALPDPVVPEGGMPRLWPAFMAAAFVVGVLATVAGVVIW